MKERTRPNLLTPYKRNEKTHHPHRQKPTACGGQPWADGRPYRWIRSIAARFRTEATITIKQDNLSQEIFKLTYHHRPPIIDDGAWGRKCKRPGRLIQFMYANCVYHPYRTERLLLLRCALCLIKGHASGTVRGCYSFRVKFDDAFPARFGMFSFQSAVCMCVLRKYPTKQLEIVAQFCVWSCCYAFDSLILLFGLRIWL